MIRVFDNFLDDDHYDALGNTPMTFSEVQWVGRRAKPDNVFHEFIHKIFRAAFPDGASSISGATAWWNIRPTNPKPHSDIVSYCTAGGVDYTPKQPPEHTFIYYLRAPDKGGRLNIYTKPPITDVKIGTEQFFSWAEHETDSIAPVTNRLISFPMSVTHAVQPYEGNRVSIGAIFWNELPTIYGKTNPNINTSYDRPWAMESNKEGTRKLTEQSILKDAGWISHPGGGS
jgi:hypothetical protein|tara:strand:+ start:736 stop:1422 length:687 start_codon:yes stop_codon:yes gene_type:complete